MDRLLRAPLAAALFCVLATAAQSAPSSADPSRLPPDSNKAQTQSKPYTTQKFGSASVEVEFADKTPLPSNISVVLTQPGKRIEASERNGLYFFEHVPTGRWTLTVTAKGALAHSETLIVAAEQPTATRVSLESTELADVVHIRGNRNLLRQNVVGQTTALDKNILTNYGSGNNLRQVIETAPGVTADSIGNIVTRGEHNSVNYEIDGAILPEAAGVLQQTSVASPRSLQSAEVQTGGFSASEGGGPMGAIVHLKSMPLPSKPIWQLGTQLGGPINGGVNFYGSTPLSQDQKSVLNKIRVESSGSIYGTKLGMQPPTRNFRRDARADINVLSKIEFRPDERNTWRITAAINESYLHIPTSAQSRAAGVKIDQHDRQNYVMLSYLHKFDKWFDTADLHIINAFYSQRYKSTQVFDPNPIINGSGFLQSAAPIASRRDYALSFQGNIRKTAGYHHLSAGFLTELRTASTSFQSTYYNADPNNPNGLPYAALISPFTQMQTGPQMLGNMGSYRGNRYLQSVYFQDSWHPTEGKLKRMTVDSGVRVDVDRGFFGNSMGIANAIATIPGVGPFSLNPFQSHKLLEAQVSGRYGLSYLLTKHTICRANYCDIFNPAPVDMFVGPFSVAGGPSANGIFNGSPRPLRATRGRQVETNIEHQLGPRFAIRTSLYYKELKNFGDSGVMDNTLVYNRLTLSGQNAYGVETRLDLKPSRDGYGFNGFLSNTVGVSYLTGIRQNTGGIWVVPPYPPPAIFPDHDRREYVSAALGYKARNGFWIYPYINAATGFKDDRDPAIYGPHSARTAPWYTIGLNAGVNVPKTWRKERTWCPARMEVRIENLTNNVVPINLGSPFQGTRYTIPIRVVAGMYWNG